MVAQRMPQPFRHPKTHVLYYRKVVPRSLRAVLKRTEFRISLGTKDLREAKRRYLEKAAEVDALLARAAGEPVTLTHRQITALAGKWYRQTLGEYRDNPGDPLGWEVWWDMLIEEDRNATSVLRAEIDNLLATERLCIAEGSRAQLHDAVVDNSIALARRLITRAEGDYRPDPLLETIPDWEHPNATASQKQGAAVPVSEIFEAWEAERQFSSKTAYSWQKTVTKLTAYLGHDDMAQIKDTDIIGFKDILVSSGQLSPKTIENHLIIIRAFFRWAAENKRIASDPAANVRYRAKQIPGTGRLSYSDDDARAILAAARDDKRPHVRWVPWLAAFTGARVDELCGAMVADVRIEGDTPVIRIDPANREKGGSVKNEASVRTVPLHPALIAEGFMDYAASLPKDGPLFPNVKPDRFSKRGGNGTKTLGRWVRETVGITDTRKAPNHSWRHRFADECRKAGISRDVRFAIDGHALREEGDKYGSEGYPLSVLAEAVAKLPNPLDSDTGSRSRPAARSSTGSG